MKTQKEIWDQMVDATVSQMNNETPEKAEKLFAQVFADCNEKLIAAGIGDAERADLMMDFAVRVHEILRGSTH